MVACRLRGRLGTRGRRFAGDTAGLTVIELMVVVAVIGLLAAIALSQIQTYKRSVFDARAKSDLRNAATAEEAFFLATGDYLTCADAMCGSQLPDFRMSGGVSMAMTADNGAQPTFTGTATANGGGKTFTYNSAAGGMVN